MNLVCSWQNKDKTLPIHLFLAKIFHNPWVYGIWMKLPVSVLSNIQKTFFARKVQNEVNISNESR